MGRTRPEDGRNYRRAGDHGDRAEEEGDPPAQAHHVMGGRGRDQPGDQHAEGDHVADHGLKSHDVLEAEGQAAFKEDHGNGYGDKGEQKIAQKQFGLSSPRTGPMRMPVKSRKMMAGSCTRQAPPLAEGAGGQQAGDDNENGILAHPGLLIVCP